MQRFSRSKIFINPECKNFRSAEIISSWTYVFQNQILNYQGATPIKYRKTFGQMLIC
ncbi:Uncharacterized protein dnm_067800 [Desulfonema magnum]|uniref:Uncharacterized protein n=1 Tax=Desulfonema magnum TaxID=45655 RepID=A0A975GR86_9BACT|nr:Uncharacterized protein dnm_067800 [Desulfonema magnum]